MNGTSNSTSK
jgi:hypothetical protein